MKTLQDEVNNVLGGYTYYVTAEALNGITRGAATRKQLEALRDEISALHFRARANRREIGHSEATRDDVNFYSGMAWAYEIAHSKVVALMARAEGEEE